MARKIRELIRDLEKAGFVCRSGKGSHRNFMHISGAVITISGHPGDDAKPYQEKMVKLRIKESQGGFKQRRADFKAYLAISGIFNRQEAVAVDNAAGQLSRFNYMRSGVIYIMSIIAARRRLWWLVDVFVLLLRGGKSLRRRLRKH